MEQSMQSPKKIAVAGATGRVGHHVVNVLKAGGHDVVPMSRSLGVDVITGSGLAAALTDVECVIDTTTGPSAEQEPATEFFTTAARNLQEAGQRAGVQRMVVVSIIGVDHSTGGYGAAKLAHEQAMLAGPVPALVLRAAQFHEFVPLLMEWGTQGDVAYVPRMRTQLVAARTVAETLADLATAPEPRPSGPPFPRWPGPARKALSRWPPCSPSAGVTRPRSRPSATRLTGTGSTKAAACSPARTPSWAARLSRTGSTRRTDCFRRAVARAGEVRRSRRLPVRVSACGCRSGYEFLARPRTRPVA